MALVLKEKINLTTPQGVSEVQLLFGNITNLPLEEKVDAIFVSSFPGDYTAVPSTLIGALKRNLGVVVGDLAKHKEVNLLHRFNCWVSKPLSEDVPFHRLVCFERKSSEDLLVQISGIFRAMMPVFNNQDTSVITPLLASGNQGHSKEEVLKSTVTAACHWIKAGLPLRCLKIVIYVPDNRAAAESDAKLIMQFLQYKKKWEKKTDQKADVQKKKYDVCLSYAGGDESLVEEICRGLCKVDTSLVIFKELFTYNHKAVWQEQIFNVMVNSRRIVAVLTANYVEKVECLDQFNLALCCNRLSKSDVLFPFYLQTIPSFPSYMMLIQYTECRVRKEGEVMEEKIITACSMLVTELSREGQQQETVSKKAVVPASEEETSYDIFISYAHRTPKEAGLLYQALQKADSSLKIFLDRDELKTGNVWQETLYEAVDSASLVVAFISQCYLQSTVCQEEYNIALARFLTEDGLVFIPILIEDITDIPSSFASAPMVDMRDPAMRENSNTYQKLAENFIQYLLKTDWRNQFSKPPNKMNMISVLDQWRRHVFHQGFEADKTHTIRQKLEPPSIQHHTTTSHSPKTVALSFANDCLHQASVLCELLKNQQTVSVSVEFVASQNPSGAQMSRLLDSADMVVLLLSDEYMASIQHRNELHIALCRQRMTKERPVVYLIQAHHAKTTPVYPHLLPHSINLGDRHWFAVARETHKLKSRESFKVQLSDGMEMRVYCSGLEYIALLTAALDVADKLLCGGAGGDSGIPTNILNLASARCLGKPGTVPVEECLVPFSALSDKLPKNSQFVNRGENRRIYEEAERAAKLLDELETYNAWESKHTRSSTCQVL